MSKYLAEYTNFLPLSDDLGLNSEIDMLWLMNHGTRIEIHELAEKTIWKDRKNIFLIDGENILLTEQSSWSGDSRIHVWTPCVSDLKQSNLYHFWFNWMQEIEKSLNNIQQLRLQTTKKYFFDALLGTPRNHKDIVYDQIKKSQFNNKILTSYTGNPFYNSKAKWIRGCDQEDNQSIVIYNDVQKASSSCVVPYKIYNQCWYSLIAETSGNHPNFYTEKTGKPLLAKRLFVMFAAQHHLKHLRNFGFKTFDGIIDESYDDIADLKTRYQQAWKQVEFLLTQDPLEIYKHAQPILEHNHTHFMSTNWQKEMHKKIQNISQSSK